MRPTGYREVGRRREPWKPKGTFETDLDWSGEPEGVVGELLEYPQF